MVKENQGFIRTLFKVALAKKEIRDGKSYSYVEIQQATGVATSTLTDWAKGRTKNISLGTLAALCAFLGCQPGDMLEYVPPVDLPG